MLSEQRFLDQKTLCAKETAVYRSRTVRNCYKNALWKHSASEQKSLLFTQLETEEEQIFYMFTNLPPHIVPVYPEMGLTLKGSSVCETKTSQHLWSFEQTCPETLPDALLGF